MLRVMDIVRQHGITRWTRPLVVLSACAGVTNALIRISELSLREANTQALAEIAQLAQRHEKIARDLVHSRPKLSLLLKSLNEVWTELRRLVRGVNLLHELTLRNRDFFQAAGERCSTLIFAAAFAERLKKEGTPVQWIDSRDFFITTKEFTHARPIPREIEKRMKRIRSSVTNGGVVVTQGFVGATPDGITTTIGRGGSDFSAAIMGVAVHASEIQIWTDVNGILTCDPRIAPLAETIGHVSFAEASSLAFLGAKVLHPETIWPAVEKGIPVRILSSKEPEREGTVVLEDVEQTRPLTGIALKQNIVLLRVSPCSALPDSGTLQAVADALQMKGIVPLAVSQSADAALYAIDKHDVLTELRSALERVAIVEYLYDRALISLVGPGLNANFGIAAKIFKALGRTNCEMISYGGSDITVSFVVPEEKAIRAVKRLHKEFFE
jgi:aspartate kinase